MATFLMWKYGHRHAAPADPVCDQHVTRTEAEARFGQIDERLRQCQHRVWLLAVANNENVLVNQQATRIPAKDYIVFDENWKVNRVPTGLKLDDRQRSSLKPDLK